MTVTNNCAYTIWPGMFTDLNAGTAVPTQTTGWEQDAGATVSFSVPDNWTAGRIWGRTSCDFTTNPGPNSCTTGGCNGGLVCDPSTGTGVPPATVAEFTLSTSDLPDNYDVSLVDGFNIPMEVTVTGGCSTASCPVDLNPDCPSDIADTDSTGAIIGCRSACQAGLSSDPANSPYCCTGDHDTAATCPNSGVLHYDYFKGSCPDAYAYAYDESSGTALWTCPSATAADYTITFCP
ncbi:Osmotin thaumatin-like protein [Stereum hirsutum FP-91666 SS1]|uniref:Osmotin thaumatin-like protein n=1 Tax=Stereum hirsutum (strain FP-91666) TaxID=721885 RepID=UPI0004449873|nr:Osmotin thaumatin-like protein [Stereum hirsutum FP-91666 SS1]EIM84101.1 Osmotin thaumatin-like protein [Stereum hirsutum FP-91666 SS1]